MVDSGYVQEIFNENLIFLWNINFMSEGVVLSLQLSNSLQVDFNGFFKWLLSALRLEVIGNLVGNTFGDSLYRVSPFNFVVHGNHNYTLITVDFSGYERERNLNYIHSGHLNLCVIRTLFLLCQEFKDFLVFPDSFHCDADGDRFFEGVFKVNGR